jgi:predicted TPR repeat methyltransferase
MPWPSSRRIGISADANAYDSLAEAQMAAGLRDASIASYRKSLDLNPRNENAMRRLERLGVSSTPQNGTLNKP